MNRIKNRFVFAGTFKMNFLFFYFSCSGRRRVPSPVCDVDERAQNYYFGFCLCASDINNRVPTTNFAPLFLSPPTLHSTELFKLNQQPHHHYNDMSVVVTTVCLQMHSVCAIRTYKQKKKKQVLSFIPS